MYENECVYFLKNKQYEDLYEKLAELCDKISHDTNAKTNCSYLLIETKIPKIIIYCLTNLQMDVDEKCVLVQILANICTADEKQLKNLDVFPILLLISKMMVDCTPEFFENCIWLLTNLLIEMSDFVEKIYALELWKTIFQNYQRYLNHQNVQNVFSWFLNVLCKRSKLEIPELKIVIKALKQILDYTEIQQEQIECLQAIKNLLISNFYLNNYQIKLIFQNDFTSNLFDIYEKTMKIQIKQIITHIFKIFSSYPDDYTENLFKDFRFTTLLNRMLLVKNFELLQCSLDTIQNLQRKFQDIAACILDIKIASKLVDVYAQCQFDQIKLTIIQIFKWFLQYKNSEFLIQLLNQDFHKVFLYNSKDNEKLLEEYQNFLCQFNQLSLFDYTNETYFNFEQYLQVTNELEEFQAFFEFNQLQKFTTNIRNTTLYQNQYQILLELTEASHKLIYKFFYFVLKICVKNYQTNLLKYKSAKIIKQNQLTIINANKQYQTCQNLVINFAKKKFPTQSIFVMIRSRLVGGITQINQQLQCH